MPKTRWQQLSLDPQQFQHAAELWAGFYLKAGTGSGVGWCMWLYEPAVNQCCPQHWDLRNDSSGLALALVFSREGDDLREGGWSKLLEWGNRSRAPVHC